MSSHPCTWTLSARDAVEDEESPNSCEDDTSDFDDSSDDSESSDSDNSSSDSLRYVEESLEVTFFLPEEGLQQVNRHEGGVVSVNIIIM